MFNTNEKFQVCQVILKSSEKLAGVINMLRNLQENLKTLNHLKKL